MLFISFAMVRNASDSVNYKQYAFPAKCTQVRPYTRLEGQISTSRFVRSYGREVLGSASDVTGALCGYANRMLVLITATAAFVHNTLSHYGECPILILLF